MNLSRRTLLRAAAGGSLLVGLPPIASALDYPKRPVRIIVSFPAGTAPDVLARLAGQWLSDELGQQFTIENRPGAATNMATEMVAHSAPDGYTLLAIISSNTINATLYKDLHFNFVRDIVPVGIVGTGPFVLVVTPSLPVESFSEFIAYAKAHPGKLNMASQGIGTTSHVCGELLKMMAGINFVHVPYRNALVPDLLAGQVQFYFSPTSQAIPYIKNRRLRAIAVTGAKRSPALPDVPAIAEFVPGYEAISWIGLGAPSGTPAEIVEHLNGGITAAISGAHAKARLSALGMEPRPMTPAECKTFVAAEVDKWAKVIAFAHIKPS